MDNKWKGKDLRMKRWLLGFVIKATDDFRDSFNAIFIFRSLVSLNSQDADPVKILALLYMNYRLSLDSSGGWAPAAYSGYEGRSRHYLADHAQNSLTVGA